MLVDCDAQVSRLLRLYTDIYLSLQIVASHLFRVHIALVSCLSCRCKLFCQHSRRAGGGGPADQASAGGIEADHGEVS